MNYLLKALARLAQLQGEAVDQVALAEAAQAADQGERAPRTQLRTVSLHLQVKSARWIERPDPAAMPLLLHSDAHGWGILRGLNARDQWVTEWFSDEQKKWAETTLTESELSALDIARLRLQKPFDSSKSPVFRIIKEELFAHRRFLFDAALGGIVINLIALATSFYSMQVYDRVVPTAAVQTLLVLTMGVIFATLFELVAKHVRSGLYERLVNDVDQRLSRIIFMRFLSIRLDQLPASVGGLASQMRGYETVRGFLTSLTTQLSVDAPFAILFLGLIAVLGGQLALVPAAFLVVSISIGLYYRRQVDAFALKATAAGNLKTGLLVEAIEGAETIKSGQGGWRMLSRWMKATDEARDYEVRTRNIQEHCQHLMGMLQQISYILLVACGALLISKGEMTMGGLIACSILSGRVLTPAGMIPGQLVQWAHAKAALAGLDRLWALQDDHHGCEHPLLPTAVAGNYRLSDVMHNYGGNRALEVKQLTIQAGERIGILGPVGGGKTSLLRMLSGMYRPQEGRILLDDMELSHISKPVLAEHIGFLQQDGRLFAGTLRDNLLLGLIDPGNDVILEVARHTGLMDAVVTPHPKGLQQEIHEGGSGLSGGQRQLVNLTRVFLRKPSIWLLDEPTASMDRNLELHITRALKQSMKASDGLMLVTHKPEMLELVDRVIVIVNHQVVMDGPKAEVLSRLQGPRPEPKGISKLVEQLATTS